MKNIIKNRSALIVLFDVPYPTNYGGVYDSMKRIEFLLDNNYLLDIICTCNSNYRIEEFTKSDAFKLFRKVYILNSNVNIFNIISSNPLSASIRNVELSAEILSYLKGKIYDFVLFDHIKTSELAFQIRNVLINQFFILRMHNNEYDYYLTLAKKTKNLFKKIFFFSEGIKYLFYQKKVLRHNLFNRVYYLSSKDIIQFNGLKSDLNSVILPIYIKKNIEYSYNKVKTTDFLYVGNLDLDDNYFALLEAIKYLVDNNFSCHKVSICGKCSSDSRMKLILSKTTLLSNCNVNFNISSNLLQNEYSKSKIFLNFSTNSSGVKTKLIEAFSYGILIISNFNGVIGSGLEGLVISNEKSGVPLIKELLYSPSKYYSYQRSIADEYNIFIDNVNKIYSKEFL